MARPTLEIGIDCLDPSCLAPFWATALDYEIGDLDADGVYLDLRPRDPGLPLVYFQKVPEQKLTKNRLHFDVHVDNPRATIDGLVQLGATTIGEPRSGSEGGWWQVMADPEGNEFCICLQS